MISVLDPKPSRAADPLPPRCAMETIKTQPSRAAELERLRRELLRRITQNEARRQAARAVAVK